MQSAGQCTPAGSLSKRACAWPQQRAISWGGGTVELRLAVLWGRLRQAENRQDGRVQGCIARQVCIRAWYGWRTQHAGQMQRRAQLGGQEKKTPYTRRARNYRHVSSGFRGECRVIA
jgi:hypothetical protein